MQPQGVSLKAIIVVHFILVIWASTAQAYLPSAYWAMNLFILSVGMWSVACPESPDAVLMFLILHLFSILEDIILIAVYQPRGYDIYERGSNNGAAPEFRFCTGMSIVNLILKPFTAFLLYRIFKDRGGDYGNFNIPGFPSFGQGSGGQYENIDQPVPTNHVESAGSDSHIYSEKPPMQP